MVNRLQKMSGLNNPAYNSPLHSTPLSWIFSSLSFSKFKIWLKFWLATFFHLDLADIFMAVFVAESNFVTSLNDLYCLIVCSVIQRAEQCKSKKHQQFES